MGKKEKTQLFPKHMEPIEPTKFPWGDETEKPKIRITRYCSRPAELTVVSISPKFCDH